MTRNHTFAFTSLLLLCSLSALAQQPSPSSSPTPPSPSDHPRPPRAKTHNVQYHVLAREDPGMRPELRIAPPGMWWKNPDIVQKLSLTSDQQKRMDDIFQQSRLQLIDLKANVEKQEVLLEPMLSANPPDTNKVLAQIDRVASARAELEKANARMLLGIRGVLSADQWTKLQAEQRENQRFLFHFKGPDGPVFRGPGGPGPGPGVGPKGPGPESFRVFPHGPTTSRVFPRDPLSQLASPSFDLTGPSPSDSILDLQPQILDDDLDL